LETDAFVAGEPLVDDFLRWEPSKTIGELVLDELDLAMELLLIVRSRSGADGADGEGFTSGSSGNKENQLSPMTASFWNMGEVS
jgi:hypothetical protein